MRKLLAILCLIPALSFGASVDTHSVPQDFVAGSSLTLESGVPLLLKTGSSFTIQSGVTITGLNFSSIAATPTTIAGYGITDFNSLGDARWSALAHTHTFASLTSKPTTLSGYGITDGVLNTTTVNGHVLSSNVTVSATDVGAPS